MEVHMKKGLYLGIFVTVFGLAVLYGASFKYKDKTYGPKDFSVKEKMAKFCYDAKWGFAETKKYSITINPVYFGASDFKSSKALALKSFDYNTLKFELVWLNKKGKETPQVMTPVSKMSEGTPVYYSKSTKLYILSENGVNLRSAPGLESEKIVNVPHGGEVTIAQLPAAGDAFTYEKIPGYWVKVKYKGKTGWIFDGFLSFVKPFETKGQSIAEFLFFTKKSAKWKQTVTVEIVKLSDANYSPDSESGIILQTMTVNLGKSFQMVQLYTEYPGGVTMDFIYPGLRLFELFQLMKTGDIISDSEVYQGDSAEYNFPLSDYYSINLRQSADGYAVMTTISAD